MQVKKAIEEVQVNYVTTPLGVEGSPVFSWRPLGFIQQSYRIIVMNGTEVFWDSDLQECADHSCIEYQGKDFTPLTRYTVFLTCNEEITAESWFVSGCSSLFSWAKWIGYPQVKRFYQDTVYVSGALDNEIKHAEKGWAEGVYLQKSFSVKQKGVYSAYLAICGVGFYHAFLNGQRIGDSILQPAQTDYHKRALYNTFNVASLLAPETNNFRVVLGNGRHIEGYGYAADPRMIAVLEITYDDGEKKRIVSDSSFLATGGPLLKNSIYEGVCYDARKEEILWDDAVPATVLEGYHLEPEMLPPIRKTATLSPLSLTTDETGATIVDFGQNSSGYVVYDVFHAHEGDCITLEFSEILDDDGNLITTTSRRACASDVYICKGNAHETFTPQFTYHGFRYVRISGYPGILEKSSIRKIVLHTDLKKIGSFYTSNPLLEKIHENITWSQRSNVMGIPTDCPQREERMGWLGDCQLASKQAVLEYDMAAFYRKFLDDIWYSQRDDGALSDVTPVYWSLYPADPIWGSAYATLLWTLYDTYGDVQSLKRHYVALKKYIDYLYAERSNGIIEKLGKYGDWCPPSSTFPKRTPIQLTSTWAMLCDTKTFIKIAQVLGHYSDVSAYQKRYAQLVTRFNEYFNVGGKYLATLMSPIDKECSTTSQILPLYLGIVPQKDEKKALRLLLDAVERRFDYHLDCGIVGLRYIYDVLLRYGCDETAYKLMSQKTYPSLGYMVKMGATTLWERWEYLSGMGMNSHNHIMYGSPNAYFYEGLCGLRRSEKGCQIAPFFPAKMKCARAETRDKHGVYRVFWQRKSDEIVDVSLTLPLGMCGKFIAPQGWMCKDPVHFDGQRETYHMVCHCCS